ncbi:MAG: D-2-hydroxyacid dehydrogenase [Anaerolineae bacterium]
MRSVRVVCIWEFSPPQLARLQGAAPGLEVRAVPRLQHPELAALLREAEVLLASDLPAGPQAAPHLRWLQIGHAGLDDLCAHPIVQSGIAVTNASGIHAVPMAEHVLGLMLMWCRQLHLTMNWQSRRLWPQGRQQAYRATDLRGKTLGIIGYGSIGREAARLAQAHGMRVLALNRTRERADRGWCQPGTGDPQGEIPAQWYGPDGLLDLLRESDYVLVAAPLTPETRGMIGRHELAACRPHAFVVNVGRGALFDEEALIAALRSGQIGGVGLDVFAQEPLPRSSPLWRMENAILTPHVSGSSTGNSERLSMLFAENLARYVQGQPLLNLVKLECGY